MRFLFVFITLVGCTHKKKNNKDVLGFFPQHTAAFLRINDVEKFKSELKNNDFFATSKDLVPFKSMKPFLEHLNRIQLKEKGIVGFYSSNNGRFEFLLAAKKNPSFFEIDDSEEESSEKTKFNSYELKKHTFKKATLFATVVDSVGLLSSSQQLLEEALSVRSTEESHIFPKRLFDAADAKKSANLFVNNMGKHSFLDGTAREGNEISRFLDWLSLDVNATQDAFVLSGMGINTDTLLRKTSLLFQNTNPLQNVVGRYAPFDTEGIVSFTFDSYSSFAENRAVLLDEPIEKDTLFNEVEEIGLILHNTGKAIILNTFNANAIFEYLETKKNSGTEYQGSEIISISDETLLTGAFKPLITNFEANFYTLLENTLVFAENIPMLQTIISNFKSGATFDKTPTYKSGTESLASESSMLLISNLEALKKLESGFAFPEILGDFENQSLKNYVHAAQVVADHNFYHMNFVTSKIERPKEKQSVSPLFMLELDADLATNPQFVKNHRTNQQEIVVQDNDNHLYLISTEGKVQWKKQLNGKIQGRIEQVDLYKNGKLQLAFCTNDQFLVLDRNGEIVEPFSKTFEGGNLNPLAVFDYDKKKEYRFAVTQGEKVHMYNRLGAIVDGYTYTQTESPVISKPKHFRLAQKDYLIFQLENNELKIRHRAGQERLKVKQKIDFSENPVFLYKNKFAVTDIAGVLHQIDTRGKLTKTNFNLNPDHGMYATSKTLALMNDNILTIKGKKVELELGVYTKPQIFYIYDKIYVSVTDIQNQKIYLFDSLAKPIPNFPVFGSSLIDMVDMENDRKLELVAKDQENSIISYRIN